MNKMTDEYGLPIDPSDGLPYDLSEATRRATAAEEASEAAERDELAPLFSGEWMSTAEAVNTLKERGSSSDEAEYALLAWLTTNKKGRYNLRARAEQTIHTFIGRTAPMPRSRRDQIVFSHEWESEMVRKAWSAGAFHLRSPGDDGQYTVELQLIGVRLSRDDFQRRLAELGDDAPDAEADAKPLDGIMTTGTPGRPSKGRDAYLAEFRRRADAGEYVPKPKLREVANALAEWFNATHPTAQKPTLKTVENSIRHDWQALK